MKLNRIIAQIIILICQFYQMGSKYYLIPNLRWFWISVILAWYTYILTFGYCLVKFFASFNSRHNSIYQKSSTGSSDTCGWCTCRTSIGSYNRIDKRIGFSSERINKFSIIYKQRHNISFKQC